MENNKEHNHNHSHKNTKAVRAFLLMIRFNHGKWKSITI